jgi:hypothetical protein
MAGTTTGNNITLEGPENYHSWFANTKGSVPEDLWKYFNPENTDEYTKPEPITIVTLQPEATTLSQLSATNRTLYAQLRTIYNNELSQYHRYLTEKAKLRTKLLNTVPEAKRVLLPAEESIREWISNLKLATKPSDTHMKDVTKSKHRSLMTAKFIDWPSDGPEKWLMEWHKLMTDCKKWNPASYADWASDFILVWGEVPGAKRLCDRLTEAETSREINNWDIYKASSELKQAWDQRIIRNGMRIAGKAQTTRSVFATDSRFNGLGASEEATEEVTEQIAQDPPGSKKRVASTDSPQKPSIKRPRKICWGCDGNHLCYYCPLIQGSNPRRVRLTDENRQTFNKKMEDPTFAKYIRKLRKADLIIKELTRNAEGRHDC